MASGQVRLAGARIGGELDFTWSTLTNRGGTALDLEGVRCPHVRLPAQIDGRIDLRHAGLGTLTLPAVSDPPPMRLGGLTYVELDADLEPPVAERIAWLHRDPDGFHPQPYDQLAAYYRSAGHDHNARQVLLAKRRTHRLTAPNAWRTPRPVRSLLATAWRLPGWLLDAFSGYGYAPRRTFYWLVAAVITGTVLLHDAAPEQDPTRSTAINALLLALDATVPTAPFGIREQVALTGAHYATALGLQILGYGLALGVLAVLAASRTRRPRPRSR